MLLSAGAVAVLLIACAWIIGTALIERIAPLPEPTPAQAEVIEIVRLAATLEPSPSEVERFVALAERLSTSELRVFLLSERRFGQLPREQRNAQIEEALLLGRGLRTLARAIGVQIQSARARGDFAEARALLTALERYADANTGPPDEIVILGNLIGEAVAGLAHAEREALDAARSTAATPDAPGQ